MANKIDWDFIKSLESLRLKGYIPKDAKGIIGRSGVTVATGIDLGQQSAVQIELLPLSRQLKDKLKPYTNKIKKEAEDFLLKNPLTLTAQEAQALDQAMKEREVKTFARRYHALTKLDFLDLPAQVQTVLTSLVWNFGTDLPGKYPSLWKHIRSQDWKGLANALENFPSLQIQLAIRRKREAAKLKELFL